MRRTARARNAGYFRTSAPVSPKYLRKSKKARDEDERRILKEFVKEVRALDPDVITGYNINNFDLAVLFDRANRLFGKGGGKPDEERKRQSNDELILEGTCSG